MSNEHKILIGIGVITLLLVGIAVFSLTGTSGLASEEKKTKVDNKFLLNKNSYKKGSPKAKVSLVEFGDFQCPACATAQPVLRKILSTYKNDVVLIFRQYPLPGHKNARVAAYAAEAAGAQGKFFEMHDLLYENQKDWSESTDPLHQHFMLYAKKLKLDTALFEKEVKESKYKAKIEKDISDGNAAGVNATPTFYINGLQNTGGMSFDEFKKQIENALTNAQ
jgi:protein-disulfide isomerase